jgi:hypothetical protein
VIRQGNSDVGDVRHTRRVLSKQTSQSARTEGLRDSRTAHRFLRLSRVNSAFRRCGARHRHALTSCSDMGRDSLRSSGAERPCALPVEGAQESLSVPGGYR